MTEPIMVQRGKLIYILHSDKVIVGVGGSQWISYNQYDNWNRQGITKFRNMILKSKENEYTTAAEQMSLGVECGIKGSGTAKPKEII